MRPEPLRRAISAPFWEGQERHRLVLQHCLSCDLGVFYPRPFCCHCGSDRLEWREAPVVGRLVAVAESHVPPSTDFRDGWPRFHAVVDIVPGVRMAGCLVRLERDAIQAGMGLSMVFSRREDGSPDIPAWTAAG